MKHSASRFLCLISSYRLQPTFSKHYKALMTVMPQESKTRFHAKENATCTSPHLKHSVSYVSLCSHTWLRPTDCSHIFSSVERCFNDFIDICFRTLCDTVLHAEVSLRLDDPCDCANQSSYRSFVESSYSLRSLFLAISYVGSHMLRPH